MAKEEGRIEVEGEKALPIGKAQLIDLSAGARNDRAAADRVDEDVDGAELARDRGGERLDRSAVERVDGARVDAPAGRGHFGHRIGEPRLVVVDGHDNRPLARHDVGGGAADAARRGGDDRDAVRETHA